VVLGALRGKKMLLTLSVVEGISEGKSPCSFSNIADSGSKIGKPTKIRSDHN
jgi:hypothetical protein